MRIRITREMIWPCLRSANEYLVRLRDTQSLDPEVCAGINFTIILNSACFLEGVLEASLKALLSHRRTVYNRIDIPDFETRRSMNVFYERIEQDLEQRIGRSMGADGYNKMFELVLGQPLNALQEVTPLWESITVLFQFRNVLGHGREVLARQISAYFIEEPWKEDFRGGYKRLEEYLQKVGLVEAGFVDQEAEYVFLSNAIADHFWSLVCEIPVAISASMSDEEKVYFDNALRALL